MFCNHCGAENLDKAVTCLACGQPQTPVPSSRVASSKPQPRVARRAPPTWVVLSIGFLWAYLSAAFQRRMDWFSPETLAQAVADCLIAYIIALVASESREREEERRAIFTKWFLVAALLVPAITNAALRKSNELKTRNGRTGKVQSRGSGGRSPMDRKIALAATLLLLATAPILSQQDNGKKRDKDHAELLPRRPECGILFPERDERHDLARLVRADQFLTCERDGFPKTLAPPWKETDEAEKKLGDACEYFAARSAKEYSDLDQNSLKLAADRCRINVMQVILEKMIEGLGQPPKK
jgi:hypothetical protein